MLKRLKEAISSSSDLSFDLGTGNTSEYLSKLGIVLNEPSVVAPRSESSEERLAAVGIEAKRMLRRTPRNKASRPLKDGVISDFNAPPITLTPDEIEEKCSTSHEFRLFDAQDRRDLENPTMKLLLPKDDELVSKPEDTVRENFMKKKDEMNAAEIEALKEMLKNRHFVLPNDYIDFYYKEETNAEKLSKSHFDETIPEKYLCKLSGKIMTYPVFDPADPNTRFERSVIEHRLEVTYVNPLTGNPLEIRALVPDIELKTQIDQFVKNATRKPSIPSLD